MTLPCPLCGSSDHPRVYGLPAYEIHRCAQCGFLYNASFRGGGGEDGTFSETYFMVQHREAFSPLLEGIENDPSLPVFSHRLDQIEERTAKGRLLDVGPGLGTFLRLAANRGWEVEGVEISRFAAAQIRKQHHLPVFEGDLLDYTGASQSFDAITFWDSLEHVARPRENLRQAFELLRPGGVLLLTTDNFDCLVADVASLLYRLSGGRLHYAVERVFIDRNLAYFTEESLARLLREVGFEESLREKMEYPLSKIKTNPFERLVLGGFYVWAWLLQRQAQITVLAKRPL